MSSITDGGVIDRFRQACYMCLLSHDDQIFVTGLLPGNKPPAGAWAKAATGGNMIKTGKKDGWIKPGVLGALIAGAGIVIGSSYAMTITDRSGFCGSCHSMSETALTYSKSLHAKLACNECHAPHNLAAKIPFKTKEAMRDVTATITKNVPDLIHAGAETRNVVQKNCLRCHGAVIESVNMTAKPYCTDCHRNVPHTPKMPIAKRSAADA